MAKITILQGPAPSQLCPPLRLLLGVQHPDKTLRDLVHAAFSALRQDLLSGLVVDDADVVGDQFVADRDEANVGLALLHHEAIARRVRSAAWRVRFFRPLEDVRTAIDAHRPARLRQRVLDRPEQEARSGRDGDRAFGLIHGRELADAGCMAPGQGHRDENEQNAHSLVRCGAGRQIL